MNKELTNVTKQSGIVFTGKLISLIFGLLFNFVAARFLGAEVYGEFMYILAFIGFFPLLAMMGLQQGLVYFIPKFNENKEMDKRNSIVTFSFLLVFLISLTMSLLIFINSDFIAENLLNKPDLSNLIKLMSPLIIFTTLIQLSKGAFQGIKRIKYFVINRDILIPVLKILVLLITVLIGFRTYSLAVAFHVGTIVGTIYLLTGIYKQGLFSRIRLGESSRYKELFKFSLPLLLTGYLGLISQKTDIMMIGYFLSEDQVGIYNIALRIGTLSSFILVAFNTMFAPTISSLYNKSDIDTLANMYKVITKWVVGVNLIAFALILLFSEEIMRVFGSEFIAGSTALILIAVGQVMNAGVGSAGFILIMTGNTLYVMYINFITVILNITLNFFLIPIYGIEGAAFASLISVLIVNILRLILVYKIHKIHPYDASFLKLIMTFIISFVIIYLLNSWLSLIWFNQLIGLSIVFILMFCFIYYYFGFSKEDNVILNSVIKKIKK
ncbi:Membrane protein involved in the export of O-antigen and teichoic acid [Virgibacillus subterraneus]|uniref:Membrane protein involved in the export of O-antigen and teichoic acid n=1 Tax=Virgibacillus subterraneus TaxID=621109 RepID=A0A1H9AI52_9BACI|nr:flippase [Virgibacillus subterraneus]SEP76285.1 Membrane protein involved in the export of O-antigen and teichoic acid [Virgibacillus subterraneus]